MDLKALGRKIAQAREAAGMTQEALANRLGLDRSAVSRLEKGDRRATISEMLAIANGLGQPLAFFVAAPVKAVVSRRRDASGDHITSASLDVELESFAADVREMWSLGILADAPSRDFKTPRDHEAAERLATKIRSLANLGSGPITNLAAVAEVLGLYVYSSALGPSGPDGGCVAVDPADGSPGAAVVNGDSPSGRRRMTLAHELGHWLVGDAYDKEASLDTERMINSFSIHLLAPRAGVGALWASLQNAKLRDRAINVAASFQISWSATISQLSNLRLISREQHRLLSAQEPKSIDFVRLGLRWTDELATPSISPAFATAITDAVSTGTLTRERAIELLRGTVKFEELATLTQPSLDAVRAAFTGHE